MAYKSVLENIDADESLKAFTISLCRYIVKDPEILLLLEKERGEASPDWGFIDLYNDLQDSEAMEQFARNVRLEANNHDWSEINDTYCKWGTYGWITDSTLAPFGFWGECPSSQIEADKIALKEINGHKVKMLRVDLCELTHDKHLLDEALACFDNRRYTACASLLISLIDGELIRNRANAKGGNRKTGSAAGCRITNDVSKDERYGMPGYFHLELLNFKAYITTLFARADGFENEPKRINRNFLHHGMSKRKVLRKDCIKLLIAYRKTIRFCEH